MLYGQIAAAIAGEVPARVAVFADALTGLEPFVYASRRLKARVLRQRLVSLGLRLLLPRGGARLIVLNDDDAADLAAISGLSRERMVVIPGTGVDLTQFQPSDEPPAAPMVVAMVGRMLTDKGVHELVTAVARLRAAGRAVILRLVGAPDPKNPASIDASQLTAWAEAGVVDYRGYVRDVPAVWREAHVAALPSYREGLGMSLIEAAACGRPLIATDVPGCRQAVVDGVTGMLVPARDSAALAAAIETLLTDPDRRRAMGRARARTRRNVSTRPSFWRAPWRYTATCWPSLDGAFNPFQGIFWVVISGLCFVAVTGVVRHLGSDMNPIQAAFVRYAIGVALLLPTLLAVPRGALRLPRLAPHALRGLTHGIGVMLWFYAMTQIPIADVTALGFTSPIFVTLGAALFLGERLRLRRMIAIAIGFAGMLVILRPGLNTIELGAAAMLLAAPLFAASMLLAKRLTAAQRPARSSPFCRYS